MLNWWKMLKILVQSISIKSMFKLHFLHYIRFTFGFVCQLLIIECVRLKLKLKSVKREFELRWIRYLQDALKTATYMIDAWIITCLKILEQNPTDQEL